MPDDLYYEPEAETMSRSDLTALHGERVVALAPYVFEHSGIVRQTWDAAGVRPHDIRSLDDFRERVPFTSKDSLRAFRDAYGDPFCGTLCIDPRTLTTVQSTSGTTGDPVPLPYRVDDRRTFPIGSAAVHPRDLWEVGIRPGDTVLGNAGSFRGPFSDVVVMVGATPLSVYTWIDNWEQVIDIIGRYRPVYLHTFNRLLASLDELSHDHDIKEIFSGFKSVGHAGEPMSARMRERTREWGMNVHVWTSVGDMGMAYECAQHDGCHIWEDYLLVECLDPAGDRPMRDGEVGELVVTALENRAAPLVRYRTDDLVRLTREPCACGRTHARMWPVGRKGDETIVQGRTILPQEVWAAVELLPETSGGVFQIIRPEREMEVLRLRVGYNPASTGSTSSLADRLADQVLTAVGVRPTIELVTEQEILARAPMTKLPRVTRS